MERLSVKDGMHIIVGTIAQHGYYYPLPVFANLLSTGPLRVGSRTGNSVGALQPCASVRQAIEHTHGYPSRIHSDQQMTSQLADIAPSFPLQPCFTRSGLSWATSFILSSEGH